VIRIVVAAACAAAAITLSPALAAGQNTPELPDPIVRNDTNPTDAVLFSIRPEIYKPNDNVTLGALIFRYDNVAFPQRRLLPGRRGVVMRFEMPIVGAKLTGAALKAGLGDAYAQLLVAPYFTRRFAYVVGTGIGIPTATDRMLGSGKWVVAPVTGPVWFFGRRGMALIRVQGFTSVGGDDSRPDIGALVVGPLFMHSVAERTWVLVDTESRTSWELDGRTSFKSGVQLGQVIASKFALWAKPEVFWGESREGQWNLKFGLVWYR